MKIRPVSVRTAAILAVVITPAIFLFDISQPLGIAGGMPYVGLPLLALLARAPYGVTALAVAGTLLTGAGVFFSPEGAPISIVALNRGMSIVLIWVIAGIALRHLAVGVRLRESLTRQASEDSLTGLFNRRYAFDIVDHELNRYRRYGDPFSLILIDADHFKIVNDTYGHCAGDRALRRIADACRRSVRESDVVARFGGEEFMILLPGTQVGEAAIVAERIRYTIGSEPVRWETHAIPITVSLGVAQAGRHADTFDALLKAADGALYAAKRRGRDQLAIAGLDDADVTTPTTRAA